MTRGYSSKVHIFGLAEKKLPTHSRKNPGWTYAGTLRQCANSAPPPRRRRRTLDLGGVALRRLPQPPQDALLQHHGRVQGVAPRLLPAVVVQALRGAWRNREVGVGTAQRPGEKWALAKDAKKNCLSDAEAV